jgi:putative endonuclease
MAGLVPATHDRGPGMVGREAYIVVTSEFADRMWKHREGVYPGFTERYGLKRLVWCGPHESMIAAVQREKSLKKYKREWKINLIERDNPHWDDLYPQIFGSDCVPGWPAQGRP